MITYSVKLLTLGKATRAPYKRAPASELSFCCRSGRATARPLLNILLLSSLAKRSKHISFYLFNKASVSEPYTISCYFSFREVSSLLFIIRILCYSLLKRVSCLFIIYSRASEASVYCSLLSFFLRK